MNHSKRIEISHYRYDLPVSRIARYPLPRRDHSQLLFYERGRIEKRGFWELPEIIPEGSWLVFNNTRVIQARLYFRKPSGARIEVFCLEPVQPAAYELAFQATGECTWKCLVGNARKWKEGPIQLYIPVEGQEVELSAWLISQTSDDFTVRFSWDHAGMTFGGIMERVGQTPIPPYLNRRAEESDRERYQTVYSRDPGSVAAPTAGLHFTGEMMKRLELDGIRTSEITLHVGTGTFVPVKEEDARGHSMHTELVVVGCDFLEQWSREAEQLLAVGTTTTRSLESIYWMGVKLLSGHELNPGAMELKQWENEQLPGGYSLKESLQSLTAFCRRHGLDRLSFTTRLMIVPGYTFRAVNGLITNFHMPGSTLLLLIAAFIGEDWRKVYSFALQNQFRFLSYGDSSLLLPGTPSITQQ
jgi:S-adenosylmethionine:tRNA ribosyltransferase-isomerase